MSDSTGTSIRELRRNLRMTQEEFAHTLGITVATVNRWENGHAKPSKLARRAIDNALRGQPDMSADPRVQARCTQLVTEAQGTLKAIQNLAAAGVTDPLTDPATLAKAVTSGILDAPQLKNNRFGKGQIRTQIIEGACEVVDASGRPLTEQQRMEEQ